jgi:hypothetical protein
VCNLVVANLESYAQNLNLRVYVQIQNAIKICQIISQLKHFARSVFILAYNGGIKRPHIDIDAYIDSRLYIQVYIYIYIHIYIYIYRVRINYQSILQNHNFTNTEQKYTMLLTFERGIFAVSQWP